MAINRYFDLYLNAGQAIPPTVHVNQYDKGEYWFFTLYDENGNKFVPTSASIVGRKADKKAVTTTAVISGEYVRVTETEQMTAAAGKATFELKLDNNHGTANFVVDVEPAPVDDNADYSATDLTLIQRGITAAQDAIDAAASIDGELNGWTLYSPGDFPTTMSLAEVVQAMSLNSMWFHNVNATTEYGGLPVVGLLGVIKVNNARNIIFLKNVTGGVPNGRLFVTSYGQNEKIIGDWQEVYTSANLPSDTTYSSLYGVPCLLIGNSFAAGTGGTSGRGWVYYFQQRTSCTATYIRQNGGDFVAKGNGNADYPNKTYLQALQEVASGLSDTQKRAYKYVIVGGGYNDGASGRNTSGAAAVKTAIETFISYCKTNFPNAKIFIIPLYSAAGVPSDSQQQQSENYWATVGNANGVKSCLYSSEWFYGDKSYSYTEDTIHLNDYGYQRAASLIEAFVTGWDGDLRKEHNQILYNSGGLIIQKVGRVCEARLVGVKSIPAASAITSNAYSDLWMPQAGAYSVLYDHATKGLAMLEITSSGEITIRQTDNTVMSSYNLYGRIIWLCKG